MPPESSRRLTFRKPERLVGRKAFEELIQKGTIIHLPPFRLTWLRVNQLAEFPVQVAFSVTKRKFKNATERNRVKRLMRETYRKNKGNVYALLSGEKISAHILIQYTGTKLLTYDTALEKLPQILQQFAKDILQTAE